MMRTFQPGHLIMCCNFNLSQRLPFRFGSTSFCHFWKISSTVNSWIFRWMPALEWSSWNCKELAHWLAWDFFSKVADFRRPPAKTYALYFPEFVFRMDAMCNYSCLFILLSTCLPFTNIVKNEKECCTYKIWLTSTRSKISMWYHNSS